MRARFPLVAIVVWAVGCKTLPPPAAASHSADDDAREVEALLRRWYDASEKHDSAGWTDVLLPELFIFEDTTVYDKTTLTQGVVEGFALGIDRSRLYDFKTAVSGDAAWSSFRNDEVWTPTAGPAEAPRRFLESAVFRRVGGKWFIERYHATRINR